MLDGGISALHGYLTLAVTIAKLGIGGWAKGCGMEWVLSRHGWQRRETVLLHHHLLRCLHTCPGLQAHSPAKVGGGRV